MVIFLKQQIMQMRSWSPLFLVLTFFYAVSLKNRSLNDMGYGDGICGEELSIHHIQCGSHSICGGEPYGCYCGEGYFSPPDCDQWYCGGHQKTSPDACSGRGDCFCPYCCWCNEGYVGENCEIPVCYNFEGTDYSACSGNGECIDWDECKCLEGYHGLECQYETTCFHVRYDNSTVCSSHGKCVAEDNCTCSDLFFGLECASTYCFGISSLNTDEVCGGKGICKDVDVCGCQEGYFGAQCNITSCFGKLSNEVSSSGIGFACSSHGECVAFDTCQCDPGYTVSPDCSVWTCNDVPYNNVSVCGGQGTCEDLDMCVCNDSTRYKGETCEVFECFGILSNSSDVCTGHGDCIEIDTCLCFEGYNGGLCDQYLCFGDAPQDDSVCSGNGNCIGYNYCVCNQEYGGSKCDEKVTKVWLAAFAASSLISCGIFLGCMVFCVLFAILYRVFMHMYLFFKKKWKTDDSDQEVVSEVEANLSQLESSSRNWNCFRTFFWKFLWLSRNLIISYAAMIALLVIFLFNLSNTITTAGVLRILEEPACFRAEIQEPVDNFFAKIGYLLINSIDRFYHLGVLFLLTSIGSGIFLRTFQFMIFFIWDWDMGFRNISELAILHLSSWSCFFNFPSVGYRWRRMFDKCLRLLCHFYFEVVPIVFCFILLVVIFYYGGNLADTLSGYIIAVVLVVLIFSASWYVFSIFSVFRLACERCICPSRFHHERRVGDQEEYLRKQGNLLFSILGQTCPRTWTLRSRILWMPIIGITLCFFFGLVVPLLAIFLLRIFQGDPDWEWLPTGLPIHFTTPIALSVSILLVSLFCLGGVYLRFFYMKEEEILGASVEIQSRWKFTNALSLTCEDTLQLKTRQVIWVTFLLVSFLVVAGTAMLSFGRMYVLLGFMPFLVLNLLCVSCCFLTRFHALSNRKRSSLKSSRISDDQDGVPSAELETSDDELSVEMIDVGNTDQQMLKSTAEKIDDSVESIDTIDGEEVEEGGEQIELGVIVFGEDEEHQRVENEEGDGEGRDQLLIVSDPDGIDVAQIRCDDDDTMEPVNTLPENSSRSFTSYFSPSKIGNVHFPLLFLLFSLFLWWLLLLLSTLIPTIPWTKTTFNPFACPLILVLTIASGCGGICDRTRLSKIRIGYIGVQVFILLLFIFTAAYNDWRRGIYFPWPFSDLSEWRRFESTSLPPEGYFSGKLNYDADELYLEEDRYAICDMKWSGLDVIDFLLFAELSYANKRSEDFLHTYFPQCRDSKSKEFLCELIVPERQGDVTFFHISSPSLGWHVVSIRGTKDVVDFLQDTSLWKETGLLHIVDVFVPLMQTFRQSIIRKFIWLWSILDVVTSGFLTFSERKAESEVWWKWQWFHPALYHSDIVEYILENVDLANGMKLFVTGHSLGGGLSQAVILGLNLVDEGRFNANNTQAFSFAGPGMVATSGKLLGMKNRDTKNKKIENMLDTGIINIKPDVDIVSDIDILSGIVQNVRCPLNLKEESLWKLNFGPTKCHSSSTILSSLLRSCGNRRIGRVFF